MLKIAIDSHQKGER